MLTLLLNGPSRNFRCMSVYVNYTSLTVLVLLPMGGRKRLTFSMRIGPN